MIEEIRIKLQSWQEKMNAWPTKEFAENEDSNEVIKYTDIYFNSLEETLEEILKNIQNLSEEQKDQLAPDVLKIKKLVEEKSQKTEIELKQIKLELDAGRNHAKAIRAYSQQG